MAIVGYIEQPRSMSRDESGYRTYTRTFLVRSDINNESSLLVEIAPGVPHYGQYAPSVLEYDLWARCKTITTRQLEDLYYWSVVCVYDSKPFAQGTVGSVSGGSGGGSPGGSPSGDPAADASLPPWERAWTVTKSARVVENYPTTDLATPAKKIQASNKQLFDPSISVSKTIRQVTYTGYTLTDGEAKIKAYMNTVNQNTWNGYFPDTALVTNYTSDSVFEQNSYCFKRSISLDINEDGWQARVLDQGTYPLPPAGQDPIPFDVQGQDTNHPVPLDGNGFKLPVGDPLIYLEFQVYKRMDFSQIL